MILQKLTDTLNLVMSPGPAFFMPVIVLVFVIIIRAFDKKALSWFDGLRSALMLGVAFMATGLIIGYMVSIFDGPFDQVRKLFDFNSLDLGWAPMAAISWTWPFAILMFPLQIVTNLIMLKFNKTKTLTVDLWNVWGKVLMALIISHVTSPVIGALGGAALGLIAGIFIVVIELINGDALYEETFKNTKIPNISCPHNMMLFGPLAWLVDKFLLKIPYFRKGSSTASGPQPTWIRMLGETVFAGFGVGILVALVGVYYDRGAWAMYMTLPFKISTALVLFPAAARFFVESLTPIANGVQKLTQAKFNDREIYIGLDFPILAGNPKLWLVATMIIPFTMMWSVILQLIPGLKLAFPLGGLINVALLAPVLLICKGNVRRMMATSIALTPICLLFGSFAAPIMTDLALKSPQVLSGIAPSTLAKLSKSLWITQTAWDKPGLMYWLAGVSMALTGQFANIHAIAGTAFGIFWVLLYRAYIKDKIKESAEMRKARSVGQ